MSRFVLFVTFREACLRLRLSKSCTIQNGRTAPNFLTIPRLHYEVPNDNHLLRLQQWHSPNCAKGRRCFFSTAQGLPMVVPLLSPAFHLAEHLSANTHKILRHRFEKSPINDASLAASTFAQPPWLTAVTVFSSLDHF